MKPLRHFVAVAALVSNERGEVLLKRHPIRGWEFPGGRVEKNEDLIEVLYRAFSGDVTLPPKSASYEIRRTLRI